MLSVTRKLQLMTMSADVKPDVFYINDNKVLNECAPELTKAFQDLSKALANIADTLDGQKSGLLADVGVNATKISKALDKQALRANNKVKNLMTTLEGESTKQALNVVKNYADQLAEANKKFEARLETAEKETADLKQQIADMKATYEGNK